MLLSSVSTTKNTSSSATAPNSVKSPIALGLKSVPSAIRNLPAVFVFMVIASPETVKVPVIPTFLKPLTSLFESAITAFDADTVPAVIPSTKFNSAAVDVTPSSMFNSAVVAVTPSNILSSAAVEVTPSNMFNSDAVAVTPSNMFNSDAVAVTPSKIFNSDVVAVTPSIIFNSDVVAVTPSMIFNSDAVAVMFEPPISRVVTDISPATVTTPFARVIKSVSSV